MSFHEFLIDDMESFLANLEARRYHKASSDLKETYSKVHSEALEKIYVFHRNTSGERDAPVKVKVVYRILDHGKSLKQLVAKLKNINDRYRHTLTKWKTKRPVHKNVRDRRWNDLQSFLNRHRELIDCFRYEADNRLTEGNISFNLRIASTPKEQKICLDFIRVLAESLWPNGLIRGRRGVDLPVQQRNGWVRRHVRLRRSQGWRGGEIVREVQRNLREGTWNERLKMKYSIADSTICKIAGIKINPLSHHLNPHA